MSAWGRAHNRKTKTSVENFAITKVRSNGGKNQGVRGPWCLFCTLHVPDTFRFSRYSLINIWYYIPICLIPSHFPNSWPSNKYKKGLSLCIYEIVPVSKLTRSEWGSLYSCCVQQNHPFASYAAECILILKSFITFFYIGRVKEWDGYGLCILLIKTSKNCNI